MKITYECKFCGFRSQDKDEVQKCEVQGGKNKFSVGEEVEYAVKFGLGNKKKQWERATIAAVSFSERTHEVRYSIRLKNDYPIPPTSLKDPLKPPSIGIAFCGGSANEEELRPLSVEQQS